MSTAQLLTPATGKPCRGATHRARPLEATWHAVAPLLARFGITRVANVTGLDRIGIPVFMVVRPNARGLSVAQGKGGCELSARISGVMEAIECAHAEHPRCAVRLESHAVLAAETAVVDPAAVPQASGAVFHPGQVLPWTTGLDLMSDRTAMVPFELVHAAAVLPRIPGSGQFLCSTNGLASGNTLAEAALHGLCELIERDALALWHARGGEAGESPIDPAAVADPLVPQLLERLARADIVTAVWDITSDVGVPAYHCVVASRDADPLLNAICAAEGTGCHPDPGVALIRALTEAAQSRLTAITGARDDHSRERYARAQTSAALEHHRELGRPGRRRPPRRHPELSTDTVEGDLAAVLERVRSAGIEQVFLVDLSRPGLPLHVARVIAPGLEGPSEHPRYRPGPRARRAGGGA